jgi:hypothetical protein
MCLPALDPRQKAERISAIFRARQPIDILPAELIPADLNEAYRVRAAAVPSPIEQISMPPHPHHHPLFRRPLAERRCE